MASADTTTLRDARAASHLTAAATCEGTPSSTGTGAGAIASEWPSLETLQRVDADGGEALWDLAVSPAVTALGRLVAPYVDIMATRISPEYTTIMMALEDLASDGAVASFQSVWDELGKTENGRAVIAVCHAAAQDGALLGRLYITRTAEEGDNMERRLEIFFEGKEYLPALQRALKYYRKQTADIAAAAAASASTSAPPADEWPSLESLKPRGLHWVPPEEWRMAVAPAVVVAWRIVARFVPVAAISFVSPSTDAVVMTLQGLGLDEKIPLFLAEWEKLGSTRDGRAVMAVCDAVSEKGMGLGERHNFARLAADPGLDRDLEELYGGKECFTVLQAAVRYYRANEPAAAGGGGGAGTSGAGTAAAGGAGSGTDAAAAPEWPSLELLQRVDAEGSEILWTWAVSPAVTALGRLVEPYVDSMVTRISPDYTTIMMALKALASDGAVASFQAAWDELGSTPNGRAVIAVCHAATADGALLGRLYMTRTAEEDDMESRLAEFFEGQEYQPALLAALKYYREQTAKIAAAAAASTERAAPPADELPSLESLMPYQSHWVSPEEWRGVVAPALVVVGRIVECFIPASVIATLPPTPDAVVMMLQDLELDVEVPKFLAAWKELGSTRDGRAVIAVCAVAVNQGVGLGDRHYLARLAADPGMDRILQRLYGGKECLPALQAAVRYYRAHEPAAAGGGGGGASTGGAGTAAAGGAESASGGAATASFGAAAADVAHAAAADAAAAGGM